MSIITKIDAREILDSRGNPTLEVDTILEGGHMGRFAVPSGASTGKHEALEKRDNDPERFAGKGEKALAERIEREIAPKLLNQDFNQRSLDALLIALDGTPNKSNLGANAILGISMSFAKAESLKRGWPLYRYISHLCGYSPVMPTPMLNIINGGVHADSGLDIQEFMIIPLQKYEFSRTLENCDEVFMHLKEILKSAGMSVEVGDEGGFAPHHTVQAPAPDHPGAGASPRLKHREALDFMIRAIESAGFRPGIDFAIAIDAAASEFYKDGKYILKSEGQELDSAGLLGYYDGLLRDYPIISVEDPFAEDDWAGNAAFTARFGDHVIVVGDDLFVTNVNRLEEGIAKKAANAILIKLNQIGTLTETLDVMRRAKGSGFRVIVSHRSGETEDTSIAHLAVGAASGYIKTGSLSRGERTAKYNELLRIEEELNK